MKPRSAALLPTIAALLIGGVVIVAPGNTESAAANGDTRTIYLHHAHTKESIAATFLVDGRYDLTVLEKLNWFLRDWRRDEATKMDPRLFDTVWEVYRESGSGQPIEVMSAFRSAETNAMLRRRSRAVAEHSQHILGKAMDQHYVDVPVSRIRELAMKLQRGGVGFYPTAGSPFVHMDVGGVRHWPRMSYDQLARLFPDGKTVHIPSNGQPLSGYEEARAELEARGDNFAYPTANEVKSKGLFAWLFGGDEEEDSAAASVAHDNRRGPRMASLDGRSTGAIPNTDFGATSSKSGGMQAFTMGQSTRDSVASAYPPSVTDARRVTQPDPRQAQIEEARRQTAALEEQRAAQAQQQAQAQLEQAKARQDQARLQQEEAKAQLALAQAMAAQEKASAEAAAKSEATPVAVADASLAVPPRLAEPTQALPVSNATSAPAIPLPPRRPVELASAGPSAPLPPDRPTEFTSLAMLEPDRAPPPVPPRKDAIAALTTLPPVAGRPVNLPTAITGGRGVVPPLPPVLAYASPPPIPPSAPAPASRVTVPLPVARPAQFVAARLDRSNFRVLTASGTTNRLPARTSLGSAVSALRPAAQSNLGAFVGQASAGAARSFGAKATDLTSDHFSGAAIKPLEHVITSNITASGQIRSTTD